MNPKIIPSLALVLGGIVFSTRPAKAQPGLAIYHSLEARVAQAQSVVRGTISNCSGHFIERQSGYYGGHQEDGTQRPNGVMKYTITVQVDEVIKGKAARTIELVQETFVDDKRFEQWADHHTSFLWFFGDKTWSNLGGHDPQWSTIRLGEAVPAERGFSSDQPVYLMDFSPLADPKEILARTRRFAKNLGEASPQFHTLGAPPNGPLWSSLVVPVQPSLEKIARQRIESGDRVEGAKALRYFKSASNIKLLKPFLNDPGSVTGQTVNCPWKTKRTYPVRQAAYDVLQEWGVQVPKPVMEEDLPWHFDPSLRQKLEVQLPTKLWIRRTTNTFEMGSDIEAVGATNIMTGSNMINGVRFTWFVYPEGEPRPATACRLDLEYWPTPLNSVYFSQDRGGFPVQGRKYNVEMDFTLFETDNPPPESENVPRNTWRPEDGKNYRVLLQRTLTQTAQ